MVCLAERRQAGPVVFTAYTAVQLHALLTGICLFYSRFKLDQLFGKIKMRTAISSGVNLFMQSPKGAIDSLRRHRSYFKVRHILVLVIAADIAI